MGCIYDGGNRAREIHASKDDAREQGREGRAISTSKGERSRRREPFLDEGSVSHRSGGVGDQSPSSEEPDDVLVRGTDDVGRESKSAATFFSIRIEPDQNERRSLLGDLRAYLRSGT